MVLVPPFRIVAGENDFVTPMDRACTVSWAEAGRRFVTGPVIAPAGIVFVYGVALAIPVTLAVTTQVPGVATDPAGILTFAIVRSVAVTEAVPVGGLQPAESVGVKVVT
jgi:hypothetical protein